MISKKQALVCGAGGFIGGHLVKKLKEKVLVRGVDIKYHEYCTSTADEFIQVTCVMLSYVKKF